MPDRTPVRPTVCVVPGCAQAPATFLQFPRILGYCSSHGGVIADFLSLVDSPSQVGFDGHRLRWENIARRRDGRRPV